MCIRDSDYGGPFMIRHGGQKSRALSKAYVSLFICLATRAIHLELVSDLTASAFVAALRRFMARRGIPSQLYSDNGTNFRKARNVLHDLYNLWHNKDATSSIQSFTTSHGIKWSFIPPSSPHFGGLWESGITVSYTHLDVYKRQGLHTPYFVLFKPTTIKYVLLSPKN